MHRCEFIFDKYEQMIEDRYQCRRLAWHYYQPWRQWFCGYHRRYLHGLHGMRCSGWRK